MPPGIDYPVKPRTVATGKSNPMVTVAPGRGRPRVSSEAHGEIGQDIQRAADLYAQGRILRQIGAVLGVPWTAVGHQLRQAGVTMRRGGPPAHAACTDQIMELRDQGLTWNEIAEQVDMTVSGAWSRYRKSRPPGSPRLSRWQRVLA